ncbi:MAG: type II secretion system major pseudopilin GspG, partial [Pseudomonadota bacterium]
MKFNLWTKVFKGQYRLKPQIKDGDKKRHQRGLTLVELMVVIVILGVLSTIVAVNVLPAGDTARVQAARTQISVFSNAMQQYRLEIGSYPTEEQGLEALVQAPRGLRRAERYRPGGYLDKSTIPLDPWDNPYEYARPGEFGEFDIYSYGRD